MAERSTTQPEQIDVGPRLWQVFAAKLASTPLTDRQRQFVVEYIKRPFGAKAARAAGYSHNRDRQQAYDNLRKPKIRGLIDQALYLHSRDCYVRAGLMSSSAEQIPRKLRYKS